MISHLLEDPTGRILISIILGLGLATILRQTCKGSSCVVIESPPLGEIKKYYYKIDDDCWKYTPYASKCDEKNSSNM